jgi:peptidoglycan/LPS O-acetylase OafA/YrhL
MLARQPTVRPIESVRYQELDSLRGLAALTVVFYHFSLLLPEQSQDVLLAPPLKLLVSGYPAVILFFLLSGFVLSLPYLRDKPPTYRVFLIKRICRIYLPYLAALVLSTAGDCYFHHDSSANSWVNLTWSKPPTFGLVAQHIGLVGSYDWFQINTAFWSLAYEMRISLAFPIIAWLVIRFQSRWLLISAGVISLSVGGMVFLIGRMTSQTYIYYAFDYLVTLHYAAIFVVGAVIAKERYRLSSLYASLGKVSRGCLIGGSLALYVYSQNVQAMIPVHYPRYISSWGTLLGAGAIIIVALTSGRFRTVLQSRLLVHLGEISYSLYLIHGTVLFSLIKLFYGHLPLLFIFPVYIGITLVLTETFHRYIERPSMLLGRRLGR